MTKIIFDKSDRYIALFCSECTSWHAFAWTRDEAEQAAASHEERCHPGEYETRQRISNRHATRRSRVNALECQ